MKMKSKKLLIVLFSVGFLLFVFNVWAGYELEVTLPNTPGGEIELTDYIRQIYLIALGAVGVAALGALVYGGLLYMLSDSIDSKDDAKKWIWGAISGLLLALAAYLILYTINPDLVGLTGPELSPSSAPSSSSSPSPSSSAAEWVLTPGGGQECAAIKGAGWMGVNGSYCSGSSPGTGYSCCQPPSS